MSFVQYHKFVREDDIAILFMGMKRMYPIKVSTDGVTHASKGNFYHNNIIGKPYGTRIETGKGSSAIVLYPTPELWTLCLPHRTQIIYTTDTSMICMYLDLQPGNVVIEAGTGSGSISHAFARVIMPHGHLYTFDFHQPRVDLAREEFFAHGLAELVSCQHRDVVAEGFGQDLLEKADAVFLDLPTPWLAIEHVIGVFRKSGGRFCGFSPCVEQVQKTCEALKKFGFTDLYTCETLERKFRVAQHEIRVFEFDSCENENMEEMSFSLSHTGFLTFAQFWPEKLPSS
ncbi:hypothetical protein Zmor_022090 [Zophobas morio]|uniref:tRNA (adenine(58)-N(1))-methyltransferase catalytic subunit TRMT61A n=1 Tax=Zophobas morio TaxID=2755281 RepID=A0AA38M017_9CUCU|nr:hypothetical protein Zmor_022090 [Zophobas morio]